MRNSRVFTEQVLSSVSAVELSGQTSHYMTRVLRLSAGAGLTLFNGDGLNYPAIIDEIQRNSVKLSLGEPSDPDNESDLKITLVQAISRGERMDYCIQKATELGVAAIQLIDSARVEVRLNEKRLQKRLLHWQSVVTSACEQSGRALVPRVEAPLSFQQWLEQKGEQPCLVLDPMATLALTSVSLSGKNLSLMVGPEGGFSEQEIQQAGVRGVERVSLGPRVLRTETAGPAAISVLQTLAGDF